MAGGSSNRAEQAAFRRKHNLPYRCSCGGVMEYAASFGRVWSVCKRCTPVQKVTIRRHALR
jgi:hypothetical protein